MTTEVFKSKRAFIEGLQKKVGVANISMNKSIRLAVFGFATEDKVYQANNAVTFVNTFNELFGEVAPISLKFTRTAGKNTYLINFSEVAVEVKETPLVEDTIPDLKEALDKVDEEVVIKAAKPKATKKSKPKAKTSK
jgi:hypothetical protein